MLANHKKGIFILKIALLAESQGPVRRLSNQIRSFRLDAHYIFLTYVQITFTNSRIFTKEINSWEGISKLSFSFESSNENIAFHSYSKGGFSPFYSPLTKPLMSGSPSWKITASLACHVISQYHVIKRSLVFMGRSPSK